MTPSIFGRDAGIVLACYVLGSLPFGFIAVRMIGVDITQHGSGATGATNVLRIAGPAYAIPVVVLDVGKGALAAYLGLRFLGAGTLGAIIAGTAAVAGHNWSVFLKFKGGKGVAATAGVVLVAFPALLAIAVGVFVLMVALTRYVSLGSLLGSWVAVVVSFTPWYGLIHRATAVALASLITYQHRSNIRRLLSGTENKLGVRVALPPASLKAREGGAGARANSRAKSSVSDSETRKGGAVQ